MSCLYCTMYKRSLRVLKSERESQQSKFVPCVRTRHVWLKSQTCLAKLAKASIQRTKEAMGVHLLPPPIPAVIKIMSASWTAIASASCDSSAACSPRLGFPPVPRPRVSSCPICSLSCAADVSSACESVLTARNSTPCRGAEFA